MKLQYNGVKMRDTSQIKLTINQRVESRTERIRASTQFIPHLV